MSIASKFALASLLVATVATGGCEGPSARVKGSNEGNLVDVSRGGTETYKQLIHDGVVALLEENKIQLANASEKPLVAFVGVENRSSEELGEFRASMTKEIETALVNSRLYAMISMRAVDAAKREANIRSVDDLTVARPREAFLSVLNRDGKPPQYLLFGDVTTMTSRGNDARERTYQLTLQLMDSSSGIIQSQKTVELRKEYTN
jgi:peptidoglycan-synthase activator LpoB